MKYKLLVLDFDGTLADSFPFFIGVFGTLADAHGFRRIDDDDIEHLRGYDARALMRHVGLPLWKFPQVGAHFKRLMAASIGSIPLFDGMGEALQHLSAAGVTLAVVSSNAEENVRAVLGVHASLISYFECGVDLFGKAHKLARMRKMARLLPHEMLSIGDEMRDLEAARSERIPFGAVAWGYSRLDALQAGSPDEVFREVKDLKRLA